LDVYADSGFFFIIAYAYTGYGYNLIPKAYLRCDLQDQQQHPYPHDIGGVLSACHLTDLPEWPVWMVTAVCGIPIIINASYALMAEFDIRADLLVSIAISASMIIGDVLAAGVIALIMSFGSYLEERTFRKAREGLEHLASLRPELADVRQEDGTFKTIPTDSVKVGDIVCVMSGGIVPVDGHITLGSASLDESALTGEPLPSDRTAGDSVLSGSINIQGSFLMEAESVGKDTAVQRMLDLVSGADPGKARIVRAADRWATWMVIAALAVSAAVFLFTGDVIRSVTVLVVFCPCSYVLATPTAIMAAIGNLSRKGIIIARGDALERMSKISVMAFDKTGTLTCGEPAVKEVISLDPGYDEQTVMGFAASAETMSEHPIGRCIMHAFNGMPPEASDHTVIPGKGMIAIVSGRRIAVGNPSLMSDEGAIIKRDERIGGLCSSGCTPAYVSADGRVIGAIMLSDTVRPGARETVSLLRTMGAETIMITGDADGPAGRIASETRIAEYHSGCLPDDKVSIVGSKEAEGVHVCMIGDGINDIAAMHSATVGIAMGTGRDAVIGSADMIVPDIGFLPHIYGLSKRMQLTIHLCIAFSTAVNILSLLFAVTGIIDPVMGSLIHNIGSVSVISASVMLLGWRVGDPGCIVSDLRRPGDVPTVKRDAA